MLIEFHAADRMYGLKALGIYTKGIEAAIAASDKVYVPTMELQEAKATADAVGQWIADNLDEMGDGEARDVAIAIPFALAFRTACSVYLGQLTKLTEKQADLLVPVEDTNVTISRLQSLADRLSGQGELAGVTTGGNRITMQFGDGAPIETTAGALARATETVRRRNEANGRTAGED